MPAFSGRAWGCAEEPCDEEGSEVAGVEEGGEQDPESSKDSLRFNPMFIFLCSFQRKDPILSRESILEINDAVR